MSGAIQRYSCRLKKNPLSSISHFQTIPPIIKQKIGGAAVRGTSVHNPNIERVWVDTLNGASNLYHDLVHFMEDQDSLDIDNPNHMWALQYSEAHTRSHEQIFVYNGCIEIECCWKCKEMYRLQSDLVNPRGRHLHWCVGGGGAPTEGRWLHLKQPHIW